MAKVEFTGTLWYVEGQGFGLDVDATWQATTGPGGLVTERTMQLDGVPDAELVAQALQRLLMSLALDYATKTPEPKRGRRRDERTEPAGAAT